MAPSDNNESVGSDASSVKGTSSLHDNLSYMDADGMVDRNNDKTTGVAVIIRPCTVGNINDAQTDSNLDTQEGNNNDSNSNDDMSHYRQWHSQHIAKSLVDNAINKTLEDLGLSPGEDAWLTPYVRHRDQIETEGVMEAIRARGLRRHSLPVGRGGGEVESDEEIDSMNRRYLRLNPIFNHIAQVSENIFIENPVQQLGLYEPSATSIITPPSGSVLLSVSRSGRLPAVQSDVLEDIELPLSDGQCESSDEEYMSDTSVTPRGAAETQRVHRGSCVDVPAVLDTSDGSKFTLESCLSTDNSGTKVSSVLQQDFLAQAVEAAITEKGLVL